MVKLLERMEYKDEAINELRQIQQSQEATISKLRKDVDQIKFEKEQLKESFLKCEFAIKSLGSIVENAEYKNKTEETNARDYDNANTLGENMDSSNVSIYRDNPTKRLPIISHLIKRNTNGPTITGQDANEPRVTKCHDETELVAFFATMNRNEKTLELAQTWFLIM
ncbi:uncharacterized protein LOC127855217 [Dreissena polymorpha]|uniref:uncharacterized protein LOC127855217 n=1 Tax=Dreissena polymorpha TaxID=45954 RepID=UPI0022650341|nr:uncharacterized protein LOC127855217 [Dreissena polymorpha]